MYNPFSVITDILSSSDQAAANDAATAGDSATLWTSFSSITQLLSKEKKIIALLSKTALQATTTFI